MRIPLVSHWRGDGDIARAFFDYYKNSVSEFHIILHGPEEANRQVLALCKTVPITIHCAYDSPFDEVEKTRRLNELVANFRGQWLLLVDSDEFVEFPYRSVDRTIRELERSPVSCMSAPMLQRLRGDGSLNSPGTVRDIFAEFPLCSERLYELMGSTGWITKYPLFKCGPETSVSFGNHTPPNGDNSVSDVLSGVTHHFKWRRSVIGRIRYMVEIDWPWAETEAVPYINYLTAHNGHFPLDGAFTYSRRELFRRGLLRRPKLPIDLQFSSWMQHAAQWLKGFFFLLRSGSPST